MNLESMQTRRFWIVGGAAMAVLVVAISWLFVIHPRLASASDTQSQADDTDFQNTQLLASNRKLAESGRNMGALRTKLVQALEALPATSALPSFTHELTAAAADTSVTLSNIGITTPSPVAGAAAAGSATPAPASSSSSTPSSDTGTTAPTTPVATAAQYQIGVALTTHGPLLNQLEFLKVLQNGPRRALVTSTLFSGSGSKLTVTTQLNIFTAPMSADQIARLRKLLTTTG